MSRERKQVLAMLAEGKITPEDAERLLDRLGESGPESESLPAVTEERPKKKPLKFLRVVVDSSDGDVVNIRVPLALVRTGIKLTTVMPAEATEKLNEQGIDLSQLAGLEGEELIQALEELSVDVDSADGDKVRIFCE
jgi:hypothetical protein